MLFARKIDKIPEFYMTFRHIKVTRQQFVICGLLWEFAVEGLRCCCYFSILRVNIIPVSYNSKKTQFAYLIPIYSCCYLVHCVILI